MLPNLLVFLRCLTCGGKDCSSLCSFCHGKNQCPRSLLGPLIIHLFYKDPSTQDAVGRLVGRLSSSPIPVPPLPNFSGGKFFAPTPVPAIATSPSARHVHWPKSLSFVHPQPFASVGRTGPQPLSLHKAFEVPQMAELHAEPPGPQEPGICLAKWGESLG